MVTQRVVVHEVSWRDLFPWLILFRTFGCAIAPSVLALATAGALLTPLGWRVSHWLFVGPELLEDREFAQVVQDHERWPYDPVVLQEPNDGRLPISVREVLRAQPNPLEPIFHRFVEPVARLPDARLTVTQAAYYLFGILWMLGVWGFFGGAITRLAAVQLGREERLGLGAALRHATRRWGSYVASPLFPLLGIALVAAPLALLGLLMRMDWGVLVAGLLWIPVLLGGLTLTVLSIGLLFGWPLMWGTIASEEQGDAFEAFSRSFSYTFQRPLHYLFYAALATFYGALAWLLVYHVAHATVTLSDWAIALGAGSDRWRELQQLAGGETTAPAAAAYGLLLIGVLRGSVNALAAGFGYGLFWCLAAAVYLLLRHDADQTELDEVFLEHEPRAFALPELAPAAVAPATTVAPAAPAEAPSPQGPPEGGAS